MPKALLAETIVLNQKLLTYCLPGDSLTLPHLKKPYSFNKA